MAQANSSAGTKRTFVILLVTSLVLAVFLSCVSHSSSSAEQKSSGSSHPTATTTTKATPKPSATTTPKPKPHPTTAPHPTAPHPTPQAVAPAYTGPRPTPPIPVGAIADLPQRYRSAVAAQSGTDDSTSSWHTVAIAVWLIVGVLALAVGGLAVVAHRQRGLPLTYVRPRTDRRDRP